MKKTILLACVIVLLVILMPFADQTITYKPEAGIVNISYQANDYTVLKVLIKKDATQYVYNLHRFNENFPLQLGSGTYTVGLYENVSGNKYRALLAAVETLTPNENAVYLASVQNINWTAQMEAPQLAAILMTSKKTDKEKFEVIYNHMIKRIVYDYEKANAISSRYLPVIDDTLKTEKGICYDYASLMASMLRSQGIKSRLIEGQSTYTSVYHAWNEVYLDGKWIIIDTTIDAQFAARNMRYEIEKTETSHKKVKDF